MKNNNISLKKFVNTTTTTIPATGMTTITPIPTTTSITTSITGNNNDNAIYALKYHQQACFWPDYTENVDWSINLTGSSWNFQDCVNGCLSTNGCTGFEISQNSDMEPYCAFWYNGACSVPTSSYVETEIDTYTLIKLIEAFTEYNEMSCSWHSFTENIDWEIAQWSFTSVSNCAEICFDSSECTGFEVAEPGQCDSPYENGYCALWYNGACAANEMSQTQSASTYLFSHDDTHESFVSRHCFSGILGIIILICCISWCCCIRRRCPYRKLDKTQRPPLPLIKW